MARLWPSLVPTLGVTAVLASLWLVAAALTGPDGPAAAALDPGRTSSIGDWWGTALLGCALMVGLALPEARGFAVAAAGLLAAELGAVHIRAAQMLAAAAGAERYLAELKMATTLAVGALAVGAIARSRHGVCVRRIGWLVLVAGAASLLIDRAQGWGGGNAWWNAGEEWSELAAYSIVASLALSIAIRSRSETKFRAHYGLAGSDGPAIPTG